MEEILKFASTAQSIRNKAFMFFWRILMAVLLTNIKMNFLGFSVEMPSGEVHFPDIINYIFSAEFVYAIIFYIFYIFLFFWLFKFIRLIIEICIGDKQWDREQLLKKIRWWYLIQKPEGRNFYLLKNKKSLLILELLVEDSRTMNNREPSLLVNIMDFTNVLFSTCFYMYCTNNFEINLVGIPYFCYFVMILMLIINYFSLRYYIKTDNLQNVVTDLKRRGYYWQHYN